MANFHNTIGELLLILGGARFGADSHTVENFFSVLTRKRIRRGSFRSIGDLQAAIKRYLAEHNAHPRPFIWKASASSILAKLQRLPA